MIDRFSAPLTHATPFHHYHSSLLRLSNVKILPRTAVHTKKLTLKGTLTSQILIQGKEEPP
jgi:hypothetical protein